MPYSALQKNQGESYDGFIERVLENSLAAKIKKSDIEDNINILRLTTVNDKDLARIAKYHKAWHTIDKNG